MRFISIFTLTASLLFALLYGLIVGIDPYNKLGYNVFNFKTKAVDFARVNKFNQVEHGKKNYTAFIMGSSSAHRYETSVLNELTGLETYNYSTQSATPEDYLAITRHVLSKFSPKLFVLSIDYEAMNLSTKTDDMFYASPLKDYLNEIPKEEAQVSFFNNSYLTLDAISASFKVVWVNMFGKAEHAYLEDGNHQVGPHPKELVIKQFNGGTFELSHQRVAYLKTIKKLCEDKGIKLVVLLSPLTIQHLERLWSDPVSKKGHETFKKELVRIFDEVWDFEDESMGPYSRPEFFHDSNHANHEFSAMILRRMFANENGPGKLLKKTVNDFASTAP